MAAAPLDRELVADVVDIIRWVVPVDQFDAEAALIAVDGLLDAFAECEQFIARWLAGIRLAIERQRCSHDRAEFAPLKSYSALVVDGGYGVAANP